MTTPTPHVHITPDLVRAKIVQTQQERDRLIAASAHAGDETQFQSLLPQVREVTKALNGWRNILPTLEAIEALTERVVA